MVQFRWLYGLLDLLLWLLRISNSGIRERGRVPEHGRYTYTIILYRELYPRRSEEATNEEDTEALE